VLDEYTFKRRDLRRVITLVGDASSGSISENWSSTSWSSQSSDARARSTCITWPTTEEGRALSLDLSTEEELS